MTLLKYTHKVAKGPNFRPDVDLAREVLRVHRATVTSCHYSEAYGVGYPKR
jgi:hypothetical protein